MFYHGTTRWSVAEGLEAMIATEERELVFLPGARFIVRALTALPTEELSRDAAVRAALIALVRRTVEFLTLVAGGLADVDSTFQKQVIEYILQTHPDGELEVLRTNLREAGFDEMEGLVGTIAEALMERGRAEGLERGWAEGLERGRAEGLERGEARSLTRLLERRFGPLPPRVRDRIVAGNLDDLDAWLDRTLDADSLDEVFGKDNRR